MKGIRMGYQKYNNVRNKKLVIQRRMGIDILQRKIIYPICILLIFALILVQAHPGRGKNIDINGMIEKFAQQKGLGQTESEKVGERISNWLEACEYVRINEFLDNLDTEQIEVVFKTALKTDILCDRNIPFAVNPEIFGQKTLLTLPVRGMWHVVQGNSGIVSHLKGTKGEYSWDFIIMRRGQMADGKSDENQNHYCWNQPILAPAPGRVVEIVDDLEDHLPYMTNPPRTGNHVYIDHENGEISLLYHLKRNSVVVKNGDWVERGQTIGHCGDTGISMFPHLHFEFFKGSLEKHEKFQAHFFGYFKAKFREQGDEKPVEYQLQPAGIPKRLDYVLNASDYLDYLNDTNN